MNADPEGMSLRVRHLLAAGFLVSGATLLAFGLSDLWTLIDAIRSEKPVIIVSTLLAGFIPLGLCIASVGVMAFVLRPQPNRPPRRRAARYFVALWIACLIAYPLGSFALTTTTQQILQGRGYQSTTIDQGFRSHYAITEWRKAPPPKAA